MYIVPPNTPHRAASVDGPAVLLDVFSPVREDYVEKFNKYIRLASAEAMAEDAPADSSRGE
jgi:hypothetical protein